MAFGLVAPNQTLSGAAVGLSSYEAQQAALAEDKNMKKLIQGVFATLTFGIAAVQARRSATSLPAC